jgi:hypothetical protein
MLENHSSKCLQLGRQAPSALAAAAVDPISPLCAFPLDLDACCLVASLVPGTSHWDPAFQHGIKPSASAPRTSHVFLKNDGMRRNHLHRLVRSTTKHFICITRHQLTIFVTFARIRQFVCIKSALSVWFFHHLFHRYIQRSSPRLYSSRLKQP